MLLDSIEDPHNLELLSTAHQAGAHGIIIQNAGLLDLLPQWQKPGLNYLPVAKVTNLSVTIEELKKKVFGLYVQIWTEN